jgi:hypothetical protein
VVTGAAGRLAVREQLCHGRAVGRGVAHHVLSAAGRAQPVEDQRADVGVG